MEVKTTLEYIEEAKQKLGDAKDIRIAELLLLDKSNFAQIKRGKRALPEFSRYRLAEILEIDPSEINAAVNLEWEQNDEKKEYWKGVFFRHSKAALIALLSYGISTISAPNTASAGGLSVESSKNSIYINPNYTNST